MTEELLREQEFGPAANAHHAVKHVQALTANVGGTIAELQAENVRLKRRLLRERRHTLEQFFMADCHQTSQIVFGSWWRMTRDNKRQRNIEKIEREMHGDRIAYHRRLVDLEEQAKAARARRAEIEKDRATLLRRLEHAEALVDAVGEQTGRYPLPPPRDISPNETAYLQAHVCSILRDIDPAYPSYTPPLHPWAFDPFEQALWAQFKEADVNGDGVLHWNNGEIRFFISRAFQVAGFPTPPWDDRTWYTMYRQFDRDGNYSMDFGECAALARAIRDATGPGAALGRSWNTPDALG